MKSVKLSATATRPDDDDTTRLIESSPAGRFVLDFTGRRREPLPRDTTLMNFRRINVVAKERTRRGCNSCRRKRTCRVSRFDGINAGSICPEKIELQTQLLPGASNVNESPRDRSRKVQPLAYLTLSLAPPLNRTPRQRHTHWSNHFPTIFVNPFWNGIFFECPGHILTKFAHDLFEISFFHRRG